MNDKQSQGASNREWGALAESIAADWLTAHGYSIRERNWRVGNHYEVDIIAQQGTTIIFVEVKARSGHHEDPVEAIDRKKRSKMITSADIYLKRLDHLYFYRFDIITITGNHSDYTIEHYPDAFLPPCSSRLRR